MVLNIFKYSGISAKTRAMSSKLLDFGDYNSLLKKNSVGEIVSYLKNKTNYSNILKDVNENKIHRGVLENILKQDLMSKYRKILLFVSGKTDAFIRASLQKYEIESLKRIFRVLETEEDTTLVEGSLLFLREFTEINMPRLLKSKNSGEFISNLEGSEYYEVLNPLLIDRSNINLFRIETALDLYYIDKIYATVKKLLSKNDSKIIDRSLGTEIDAINILWIYRGKYHFNMEKEIIYSYIIPHRNKLSKDALFKLIESKTVEEFYEIIRNTAYNDIFFEKDEQFFELEYRDFMYRLHKRMIKKNNFSIASINSYIHLKEYELQNIISVIEGIRYSLDINNVKKYLIGISN